MKHFILVCFLMIVGCSSTKATPDEVEETISKMENIVKKIKNGERPSVLDVWGVKITIDTLVEDLGEVKDDSYQRKYIHTFILPQEAKVKKILDRNWIVFEINGQERTEKFDIPIFRRYKMTQIVLRSDGPDRKPNTKDDIVHVADCNLTYVHGDIREAGESIGKMIIVEENNEPR